jgi:regulator of ribonuclease activity A
MNKPKFSPAAPKESRFALGTPTADLCDANEELLKAGSLRVLAPVFQNYGGEATMSGPIATLKCFEDNVLVRQILETPGNGRVLMVDGGGSDRCALVGGNLGALAVKNGWAGLVVNGCIRDSDELSECPVGIWAMATHPRRSDRQGLGQKDVVLDMAGTRVSPGNWCYADADGILVSDKKLG